MQTTAVKQRLEAPLSGSVLRPQGQIEALTAENKALTEKLREEETRRKELAETSPVLSLYLCCCFL